MTRRGLMISAVSAALLCSGSALAADQPGQKFQVSPASLAGPYATTGMGNGPDEISRPAGQAVAGDGSLLIANDVANAVWRGAYTGKLGRFGAPSRKRMVELSGIEPLTSSLRTRRSHN